MALERREQVRQEADLDPRQFRNLLEWAADLAEAHWERLCGDTAFVRPPEDLRERIRSEALPLTGRPTEEVLDRIRLEIAAWPLGVGQRRWWGFMGASAHPLGVAADVVASALNNPCFPPAQMAIDVERAVIGWLAEIVGLPQGAGGLLVSGGSVANLVCLTAAREAMLPGLRERGWAAYPEPVAVYASVDAHSSVQRALEVLGFGKQALLSIPVDSERRMDVGSLRERIVRDKAEGVRPLIIVATTGTVGTGRVDPIGELGEVAREEGCWLHIDGAYGGIGAALPELEPLYRGIEHADSVVLDPHKWLYIPYEAGAALVRNPETLRSAFAMQASYLALGEDAWFGGNFWFSDLGLQLTRELRALKIWAVLQAVGIDGYRELWRSDIGIAREVIRLAEEHPRLEVLSRSDLSIFCIRFQPRQGDVNAFNRHLLDLIHRDGRMVLTPVMLDGKFGLRGCVLNFRSTLEDAHRCVDTVVALGEKLEADNAGRGPREQ